MDRIGTGPKVRSSQLRVAAAAALVLAGASALSASAAVDGTRQTRIASPSADAASDNTSFSQDNRRVKLMAFDTDASNLVRGDANGRRDVILFSRRSSLQGSLTRVSVGSRGAEANGDSLKPSLDGDTGHRPHCVTFQSTATNLDPRRDGSPDWDVYVRDVRRRTTTLVSPGHENAVNGVVDGECGFVTYEAGGRVYVRDLRRRSTHLMGRGTNPDQQTDGKGVAYERGGQIYHQRYQLKWSRRGSRVRKRGGAGLASGGVRGRGNGPSRNPSMDDRGSYVAFESDATNLCSRRCKGISGDRNGAVTDVFRRTLSRRAPTRDRMQMASYSYAVSEQGNGPSNNPALSGGGEFILFDSAATNLRPSRAIKSIDPNGRVRDVYLWNFPSGRRHGNVSRESRPGPKGEFNGASVNPAISSRGNYVGFTSEQNGQAGESNGSRIPDVFLRFLGGAGR